MKISFYPLGVAVSVLPAVANAFGVRFNHGEVVSQAPRLAWKTGPVASARRCTQLFMANKVGIFFGTSTGSTEDVAYKIAEKLGSDKADGPFDIEDCAGNLMSEFSKYSALIVGTPTWNTGADTERSGTAWDELYYGEMESMNLKGKKVGVFGLGDSVSYAENYADATGELHDVFEKAGCSMLGYTSQEGYEHEDSKAIRGEMFCGLLCDAVNQEELTDDRVTNWITQLLGEGLTDEAGAKVSVVEPQSTVTVIDADNSPMNGSALPAPPAPQAAAPKKAVVNAVTEGINTGFTPNYNAKSGKTMWVSADGKSCYYT